MSARLLVERLIKENELLNSAGRRLFDRKRAELEKRGKRLSKPAPRKAKK